MSKLSPLQKDALLRRCNKIPIHIIVKKIESGDISLDEFIDSGLKESAVQEVKEYDQEEDTKKRFREHYSLKEDQDFYTLINNDKIWFGSIQDALFYGIVTEKGLLENTILDEHLLKKIKNSKNTHSVSWGHSLEDVPLKDGPLLLFFGRDGSGRTSIISSLLNYGYKNGLFINDFKDRSYNNFNDELIRRLDDRFVYLKGIPSVESITYARALLHMDGKVNPLNFIAMNGESLFVEDPHFGGLEAKKFLSNTNKKLLFFVIDYKQYAEGEHPILTEESEFNYILSQLAINKKSLKNTSIYVIVNKSDKFPEDVVDKSAFAQDFIIKNFKEVYQNLKSLQEQHGFELRSMHFSTGEFILKNSYLKTINTECPRILIDSISKQSSMRESRSWF